MAMCRQGCRCMCQQPICGCKESDKPYDHEGRRAKAQARRLARDAEVKMLEEAYRENFQRTQDG